MAASEQKRCRWWHRWPAIEEAEWVGGIAYPAFRFVCRRCGATKVQRFGV